MIIFDNNEIKRELIVPKGLNLWHFLYVKTYLNIYKLFVVVIMGGIDIIFENTTKYDKKVVRISKILMIKCCILIFSMLKFYLDSKMKFI